MTAILAAQGPVRVSDFGSGLGAARLRQAASDAVIVTLCGRLTCADIAIQPRWLAARSVRIEALRDPIAKLIRMLAAMLTIPAR